MAVDLKGMTRKQLEKLKTNVEKELDKHDNKDKKAALAAARKAAKQFGFSLSELTGDAEKPASKAKKPKAAGKPKYGNPNDKSQTWTGKGRQPNWFRDAVNKGASPESLEL